MRNNINQPYTNTLYFIHTAIRCNDIYGKLNSILYFILLYREEKNWKLLRDKTTWKYRGNISDWSTIKEIKCHSHVFFPIFFIYLFLLEYELYFIQLSAWETVLWSHFNEKHWKTFCFDQKCIFKEKIMEKKENKTNWQIECWKARKT